MTLRMLILTSKLLKAPFNQTIERCVSLLLNGKYSSLAHCERYLIFLFFSDFFLVIILVRMQMTLKIASFLFEMNCFNSNEMFLI